MGPNNIVMAWQNTKPLVVFRSRMKSFNAFIGQLFTVGLDAELPQAVPVPRGGFLSYSPDDSKMAFNRVFREFRTWKNYPRRHGGTMLDSRLQDRRDREPDQPEAQTSSRCGAGQRVYYISIATAE
jgi:tricorn protease